jgi:hypothetical protein
MDGGTAFPVKREGKATSEYETRNKVKKERGFPKKERKRKSRFLVVRFRDSRKGKRGGVSPSKRIGQGLGLSGKEGKR